MEDQEDSFYTDVIDRLYDTFNGVLERNVVATVVESYEGDLDQSANALMSIAGDLNPPNFGQQRPAFSSNMPNPLTHMNPNYNRPPQNVQGVMTYAHVSQPPIQTIPPVPANVPAPPRASTSQLPPKKIISNTQWNDTIREVILNYNKGWRVLVLMRGVPGSGKSFLSREIIQMTVGIVKNDQTHIMSSDDYFIRRGVYRHDRNRLHDAHLWNQTRAQKAMEDGISPIIIDNTNIDIWEMDPYVRAAVNNGYIVTVVEPQTPWAKKLNQLVKKNIHNVPYSTIQRMLDKYQDGITAKVLLSMCGINYPANLTPPVMRRYPPLPTELQNISEIEADTISPSHTPIENETDSTNKLEGALENTNSIENKNCEKGILENAIGNFYSELQTDKSSADIEMNARYADDSQVNIKTIKFAELKQQLEKFEQVEKAWDNGEQWEENIQEKESSQASNPFASTFSKPPRNKEKITEKPVISLNSCNDWSQLSLLPTSNHSTPKIVEKTTVVEKTSSSTSFEIGDTDINNKNNSFKVIAAVPRDINIFVPDKIEKIPDQRMLDKSTSTNNELMLMKPIRCQNEEQHFKAFRRMFSHIPSAELRDIFENCCGDVNWAVEIVIDGMESRHFPNTNEERLSDDEEDVKNIELCQCLAAYNLIPDNRPTSTENTNPLVDKAIAESSAPSATPKKIRKDIPVSEASIQIKRQIEKNVVIADNYYSQHCLKIRNSRRGENDETGNGNENIEDKMKVENCQFMGKEQSVDSNEITENKFKAENFPLGQTSQSGDFKEGKNKFNKGNSRWGDSYQYGDITLDENDLNKGMSHQMYKVESAYIDLYSHEKKVDYSEINEQPGTSNNILEPDLHIANTSQINDDQSEFDDDDCLGEAEKTVNITLGNEFLRQIDRLFGRGDIKYPDSIIPKINAPISLLNKLNALWMESLTHQLDQESKQTEAMIQQDAEFARKLAEKEEELLLAGKESQLPDFKEIMDLDYALSLYQKDVDEWRNNEPLNLAAKLTRDKLFNLFPNVDPDVLSELLTAHHNNFHETVQGVLMSTGRKDILKRSNGVARFIMNKDLEERRRYLEDQRRALSDVDWPLLPKDGSISMEDVDQYRAEATRQMKLRQKNYQKAHDYMQRGLLPAASFFSRAGAYHTRLFEQANSRAVVSLAAVQTRRCRNNATLDLHNFRVREAMESLDLFLDIHIRQMRQTGGRNGLRYHTLFFITGRGLHSPTGPKIKPACKKRLRERGLSFYELNPGLLAARVNVHNLLTDEIA